MIRKIGGETILQRVYRNTEEGVNKLDVNQLLQQENPHMIEYLYDLDGANARLIGFSVHDNRRKNLTFISTIVDKKGPVQ